MSYTNINGQAFPKVFVTDPNFYRNLAGSYRYQATVLNKYYWIDISVPLVYYSDTMPLHTIQWIYVSVDSEIEFDSIGNIASVVNSPNVSLTSMLQSFEDFTVHGDLNPEPQSCNHHWKEYIGFTSRDFFCTKCNEKKEWSP